MADVQVAVGFGRESGVDLGVSLGILPPLPGGVVGLHDLLEEVEVARLLAVRVACGVRHAPYGR
jgi:hypothetical protein